MPSRLPVRKMRIGPPRKGLVLDESYLAFIRKLPCVVCGSLKWIEAAHVGARGLSQRCSDRQTLPLCPAHHRTGPQAAHVLGRKFWTVWGLDRYRLIAEHNELYERQMKGERNDETEERIA
jgi:hypothetical protein